MNGTVDYSEPGRYTKEDLRWETKGRGKKSKDERKKRNLESREYVCVCVYTTRRGREMVSVRKR